MTPYNEAAYEQCLVELFENLGYTHVYGPDVVRDYRDPLYEDVLEERISFLNPGLPQAALDAALNKLRHPENGALTDINRTMTDYLQNGVEVTYADRGEQRSALVYLADFANPARNSFIIANQWTVQEYETKRPDMIVFLNGIPVTVIELKSPSRAETDASEAYLQLKNYMKHIPCLFHYNQFLVMSDQAVSKAGTITSGEDRFMAWKTKDGMYENTALAQFDTFFEGIFEPTRLLDILKNFILFAEEGTGKSIKIMAAYHQYYAVRKAVASALRASAPDGDGKGGVFWHTQGSGKSLSMVFFAHLLQSEMESPTVVVITDRNDLDSQLFTQFKKCRGFLRQDPVQASDRAHLKTLLKDRQANGIFFTTMQKFELSDEALSERRNIVVMADEAHRGHYGLAEKIKMVTNAIGEKVAKLMLGIARIIRNSLPKATYVGFTGTPVSAKEHDTREVFGDYIDIYDMTQAVEDGATRPVYYENRAIQLKLDDSVLAQIDAEYQAILDNEEAEEEVVEASKKHLGKMETILGDDKTIASLVDDILAHYENNRAHLLTGKAMIVAYSRPIAIKIYRRMLELRPGWQEKIAVVMTSGNQDPEDWHAIIGSKAYKEELARKFKDNASPLKIAIVVDMWLTGFDVPSLATMYVYKPMVGHNLMQAIARVNRVFEDKEGGLVVDYIGIAAALKQAMKDYTKRDQQNFGEMDIAKATYKEFTEKLEVCRDMLHGFDYTAFFGESDLERAKCISGAVNFILGKNGTAEMLRLEFEAEKKGDKKRGEEAEWQKYVKQAHLLKQALSLCSSIANYDQRVEAAFFESCRVLIMRLMSEGGHGKLSLKEVNDRINELLKHAVKSDGVVNLFADVKEGISLFDPKLLEEIAKMKEKNIALELLRKLLDGEVKLYRKTNVVKSQEFSERLQQVMNAYRNGQLTNEEVIKELLAMAQTLKDAKSLGNQLGLSDEEMAFYDALTKPEAIKDFYANEELVALTRELTESLRKNRTVDWEKKEDARAKMRMTVKKLLKTHRYPPEGMEDAVGTVIEQCELWTDNHLDTETA
ncbi:MAG: type I restriction endonuclease subunit R [Clostridia bacterium]|nr:type I restriction endonuclease subunit R [Clostridia bacterium]